MADIRILLTDKTIAQLPCPNDGWYLARDTELKGFFVVVGKRKRTFTHRRTLHISKPKGGKKRAFDIPLSRQMILCLIRAIRFGREMHPSQAREWVFPADSASGHLAETKEDRDELSKWGNDLRQTFRTIATAAGVSEIDAKLLMNHAMPGVNAGYITRHKLLHDHLRLQQQVISSAVFAALGTSLTENQYLQGWFGRGATRRAILSAQVWSLNRLSSERLSLLMGVCDFMPPWGRCQLYRCSQIGRSSARRSEVG